MRRPREFSSVRRFAHIPLGLVLAVLTNACDPIRVISVSRQLQRPPDNACVLRVLQSSKHVRSVGRSSDGTLFAELVIPAGINPPWHPDPKRPTTFAIIESQTKEGRTEFTFRVLWVGGADASVEYRRYVEGILTKLQSATLETCVR